MVINRNKRRLYLSQYSFLSRACLWDSDKWAWNVGDMIEISSETNHYVRHNRIKTDIPQKALWREIIFL
jgi:hypothetical protein